MRRWTVEELLGRAHPEPNTGCWLWMGAISRRTGYGNVRVRSGSGGTRGAHRVMYEAAVGPIPEGHVVMHRCDNPPCVNPQHLSVGTVRENNADKVAKGRARQAGSQNTQTALQDADVIEMRRRRAAGETLSRIAAAYGMSVQGVCHITTGRNWRHVPCP